ncbi:MAG TPA: sigma-70 family RNA polymerase sigma factor [Gemmataceae bacterium]|nr:sigma-70 family RNA polymerase sigma factor [Gemmataceae bacterium]
MAASVLRQLQFAVAAWREDGRTDAELLARFTQDRDERAFATLVGRHGGLVWGVCVRRLGNTPDAEDAFQATFLRLAKDARSLRQAALLPNWLYRAARCCAADVRRSVERQSRIRDRLSREVAGRGESDRAPDLADYLEHELTRLSAEDRALLLMCVVEGRTYAEVAGEIGCSIAAVHRRLVRAQDALRDRLARHSRAGAIGVAGLGMWAATAPSRVLADALEAGLTCAGRGAYPLTRAGAVAAGNSAMDVLQRALVGAIVVGLAVGLTAIAVRPGSPDGPPAAARTGERRTPESDPPVGPALTGTVCDPAGAPVPGAQVALLVRDPYAPGARGLRDTVAAIANADARGQFRVPVPDFPTWFPERVVVLQATAPGRAPVTVPVRGPGAANIALLLRAGQPLAGRLIDERARPVSGAVVRIVRIGDAVLEAPLGEEGQALPGWPGAATTTADGRFSFNGLAGCENVWVRVEHPQFEIETVRADGRESPEVVLTRGAPIELRVRSEGDRPVPGSRVTLVTDRPRSHAFFTDAAHGLTITRRSATGELDAVADADGNVRLTLPIDQVAELLVHPPAGGDPLVGVRLQMQPKDLTPRHEVVRLPRGEWVKGTVRDADGRPIAGAVVHWGRENATLPEWRDDLLVGRDALVRSGPDGTFQLAVVPGACTVRVYGGSLDYPPVPLRLPVGDTTLFAHATARVNLATGESPAPLDVRLRKGVTVTGRVIGDGTFVMCSGRVSPVRGYAALPLPTRDGRYELPGCTSGVVTKAYFLDPARRLGAVVDVRCDPPNAGPDVRLAACGSVVLQVSDHDAEPVAGLPVGLSLLIDRDGSPDTDPQPVEWFDPVNYPTRPVTGADGSVSLPALIPGARYALTVGTGPQKVRLGHLQAGTGETVRVAVVIESKKVGKP